MSGAEPLKRLGVVSLGFPRQPWLIRALAGLGWRVVPGWTSCDAIGVWGNKPVAARGLALAERRGLPVVHLEDAFLRSVRPGQMPPLGLFVDLDGPHFDASGPSQLELRLNRRPEPATETLEALDLLRHYQLSKFNHWTDGSLTLPKKFVLIADQVPQDAALGGVGGEAFREMLGFVQRDYPDSQIVIRTHPASDLSHLGAADLKAGISLLPPGHNPWRVMERADAVHVMSSHLGAEAILAGHKPVVHGTPWYAGWGLSVDLQDLPRRRANLTAEELFEGGWAQACGWFEPASGRPRSLLETVQDLAARKSVAQRMGRASINVIGCSRWKRAQVKRMLASGGASVRFSAPSGRKVGWASKVPAGEDMARIEDGFIRSRGLGAALTPPASLCYDAMGVHFDPNRASELERLITAAPKLPDAAIKRVVRLRARLVERGISKYNLQSVGFDHLPADKPILLVPGQVADDASVRLGGVAGGDRAVLNAARAAHPDAFILFRPHPDVSAGYRQGLTQSDVADLVSTDGDITQLIEATDMVWTNTSLAGFEALIRAKPVTCLGQPFYAGWGLTTDLHGAPVRRQARPTLDQLIHAALIDYPIYLHPISQQICSVETLLDWIEAPGEGRADWRARFWSFLQDR
ncbi:capsular polysaccharide biosynthesis protein [Pontivivens insulae]|uniref:Capsule polysaccharide biosynthesis protein n=1 Tax=Pontivivens insulae TaxID=1639689 RepID=A0A2R8ABQ2_9RHOB|nr:capsular polysaccharide biosynthesis protein [Pontivivens insulae]RED11160.1 capsular polysaccharide export protein [Pontivivens insulae]SPF29666.1 hypothetical protein POI8812_01982 [Pontivivens insulae]